MRCLEARFLFECVGSQSTLFLISMRIKQVEEKRKKVIEKMEGKQCKFKSGVNVNECQQRKEIRLTLKLKIENMEFQQFGLRKLECNLDFPFLVFLKLGCICKGSEVEIQLKMGWYQSKKSHYYILVINCRIYYYWFVSTEGSQRFSLQRASSSVVERSLCIK